MPFKVGDRVRKDFRTGAWIVKDFRQDENQYRIEKERVLESREYPPKSTLLFGFYNGSSQTVHDVYQVSFIYNIGVSEEDIWLITDQAKFEEQELVKLQDQEIDVLRKLDKIVGNQPLPKTIPLVEFTENEVHAIHDLMYDQYWYTVNEAKKYSYREFIKVNSEEIIIYDSMIKPLLALYTREI